MFEKETIFSITKTIVIHFYLCKISKQTSNLLDTYIRYFIVYYKRV